MPLTVLEACFLALAMLAYAIAGGAAGFDLARRRRDPLAKSNPWVPRGFLVAAFAAHAALLAVRGFRLGDHALEGREDVLLLGAFCATLVAVIIDVGQGLRSLPIFLVPCVLTALSIATIGLARSTGTTGTPVPAEARLAIRVHVVSIVTAYGSIAFAAVLSAMYLYLERQLKRKKLGVFDLPALDRLERVEGRFVVSGFALLTVSLAVGVATQHATGALGADWLWNAKTLPALVTWFACGALVAGRTLSLLAGRRQVWATLIVFGLVLVTYLGAHVPTA